MKSLYRTALGDIDTEEEAEEALGLVSIGCFGFAFLSLLCGLTKIPRGLPLADAVAMPLLFVVAGIFLPRRASRVLALVLAPLALYFGLLTFSDLLHGRMNPYLAVDAVFSLIMIWASLRGIHATFRYHRIRRSRVNWPNVGRTWARAVVLLLPGVVILRQLEQARVLSLAVGEALLLGLILVVVTECFIVQTLRRPWVAYPMPAPDAAGSEAAAAPVLRDRH
ncbi:MAG TPA: hypothetical protein VKN76_09910 [Kiloniellaceae bacterium]|nr:hypothetical protein [Kiloniellaceae bacterium]